MTPPANNHQRTASFDEVKPTCSSGPVFYETQCAARLCECAEDYVVAYEQHHSLAQFFSAYPDDKWLADHFFFNCMNVAVRMKDDQGGQLQAEAAINAGKVFESLGDRYLCLILTRCVRYLFTTV